MVLLKILSLCNKVTLICLRADNSSYVVFLRLFAVCPDFGNGKRWCRVSLSSKINNQGAWLPFLLLILTFYEEDLWPFPFFLIYPVTLFAGHLICIVLQIGAG